jgi:hypothetical protein
MFLLIFIFQAFGILIYGTLSVFLAIMLIKMPNFYSTFMRYHIIERGKMDYSDDSKNWGR